MDLTIDFEDYRETLLALYGILEERINEMADDPPAAQAGGRRRDEPPRHPPRVNPPRGILDERPMWVEPAPLEGANLAQFVNNYNWARIHGPTHSQEFLEHHIVVAPIHKTIVLMGTEIYPFVGACANAQIAGMGALFGTFKGKALLENNADARTAAGMGETSFVRINPDRILPVAQAQVMLVNVMRKAFQERWIEEEGDYSNITFLEYLDTQPQAAAALREEWPVTPEHVNLMTPQEAMGYLYYLALYAHRSPRMVAIEQVSSSYVALARRGNCSDSFSHKIVTAVREELGLTIRIRPGVLRILYSQYLTGVTGANAREEFLILGRQIPTLALRLSLTLAQATGSGLTVFLLVLEALQRYRDFPWGSVNHLTDGDVTRWITAARIIDGNFYYGFNKELGNARSTLYKAVGYVAKELLLKKGGQQPLRNYRGFEGTILNKVSLDRLIARYIEHGIRQLEEQEDGPGVDVAIRDEAIAVADETVRAANAAQNQEGQDPPAEV